MSNPTKRPRVQSLAHLSNHHLPVEEGPVAYHDQLLFKVKRLFAEAPADQTQILIGIDLASFQVRTDENKLVAALKQLGMSYQVVRFGGKTGQDTGVLITRKLPEAPASES